MLNRRQLLGRAALLSSAPLLAGIPTGAAYASVEGPPTVTPEDLRFTPRKLRHGSAAEARLTREWVDRIVTDTAAYMEPGSDGEPPSHPGFVVLAAKNGVIVTHDSGGHALKYGGYDDTTDTATPLPESEWIQMTTDTLFDMASVSKLFTALVATQLVEEGVLDFDAPVVTYLPEFGSFDPDKAQISLSHLLRHVSGFTSWINLYQYEDNAARMQAIYKSPLKREPGSGYEYSDLNLITLAVVIETVTGITLDRQVAQRITEPLGMVDTGYNPDQSQWHRVAATEYQPAIGRGMVRGEVHDENAWSFGGVAGHAGVFSTAYDMAIFGQMILNGGRYGRARILSEDSVRQIFTNSNHDFPVSAARGLGWQLDQRFYMDALSSPVSVGHTGFTGTSIVVDPLNDTIFVLLTNRVHPTRNWGSTSEYRRAGIRDLARAVPVRVTARTWFAGMQDQTTATLTASMPQAIKQGRVSFSVWYDTENSDIGFLESSSDGQTWQRVPLAFDVDDIQWDEERSFSGFQGRQWVNAEAALPDNVTALRWNYVTDPSQLGRGIYVSQIKVRNGNAIVFNSQRPKDAARMVGDGWDLARN